MSKFLKLFSRHDFVTNDHKVGQMLKKLIEKEISQEELCMTSGKDLHQTCKRIFGKSPSEGYRFKSYPSHTSFTS